MRWIGLMVVVGCGPATTVPPPHANPEPPEPGPSTPENHPATNHAPPTADEWAAAPVVPLKGAASLGCEQKVVRDWVRVACPRVSFFAGIGDGVTVHSQHAEADLETTQGSFDRSSVTVRFDSDTKLYASFTWALQIFHLKLQWPDHKGPPVGEFVGGEDKGAEEILRAACACKPPYYNPEVVGAYGCKGPNTDPNGIQWGADCVRFALAGRCDKMVGCMDLAPGAEHMCSPDEILFGLPDHQACGTPCSDSLPCPARSTCVPTKYLDDKGLHEDGPSVCL
jgi:hypothetical protein